MILLDADVIVKSEQWHEEAEIEDIIEKLCSTIIPLTSLGELSSDELNVEISISLVCDSQMRQINSEFRDKDKTTNVLSFPSIDENLIRKDGIKATLGDVDYVFLGDIVIAYETLKKESLAQNKKFCDHLTHLVVHSILHLLGHDHEDENMAKEMESLEIKILQQMGITNPYIK